MGSTNDMLRRSLGRLSAFLAALGERLGMRSEERPRAAAARPEGRTLQRLGRPNAEQLASVIPLAARARRRRPRVRAPGGRAAPAAVIHLWPTAGRPRLETR